MAAQLSGFLLPGVLAAEPSAAERETARGLVAEAARLRAAGNLRAALSRYQSAQAIAADPTTGLELARLEVQLGMLVEARGVAVEVVSAPTSAREPRTFGEARAAAAVLAADLNKRIPSLRATVTPADSPYTIAIDGVTLPREARDVAFRTDPGTHTVLVECPGYSAQRREVELNEGQAAAFTIALTTASAQPMAAAFPRAALEAPRNAPAAATQSSPVDDPARAGRIRSLIGFGVGGVALLTGSVTGLLSIAKASALNDKCPNKHCAPEQRSTLSSINTLGTVANVAIPLGLIGIAYGAYELFTLPEASAAQRSSNNVQIEFSATGVLMKGAL